MKIKNVFYIVWFIIYIKMKLLITLSVYLSIKKYESSDRCLKSSLNFNGINFPVAIKDIPKIEKMNNISVNAFGYENKRTFPLYLSNFQADPSFRGAPFGDVEGPAGPSDSSRAAEATSAEAPALANAKGATAPLGALKANLWFAFTASRCPNGGSVAEMINLLLISDNNNNQHYVYIKDFNIFMANITKCKVKKHFCMSCLQHFSSEEILNEHRISCLKINKKQNIIMPKFGSKVIFKNYFKMLRCPKVPVSTAKVDEQSTSYSEGYQHHQICGYAYKVHCKIDKYSKSVKLYRGENYAENFLRNLLKENEEIQQIIKTQFHEKMKITQEQEREFQRSTKCYICEKNFTKKSIKVRDHCHITGKYRGPAHKVCNLQLVISNKLPVVFHNLRGYDSHFIMQEIGKFNLSIEVIPTNSEKYLSFTWGQNLVFMIVYGFKFR